MIKRSITKSLVVFLGAGLGSLALSACSYSNSDSSSDDSANELVIYSERSEELVKPLIDKWADDNHVHVSVKYGDDLATLIAEEGSKTKAQVFLSKSPGSIGILQSKNLLSELPTELLDRVPATVRAKDGRWVGVTGRQRVLVYNTELVDPSDLPSSIVDLTSPEIVDRWKGKIGVAPTNGSFKDSVTAMRSSMGESETALWLKSLADAEPVLYPKNGAIVDAVAAGEIHVGLVNHYYNLRALAENPDHAAANHFLAPQDPGAFLMVSAAGIINTASTSATQADLAVDFISWLLSVDTQTTFATETYEFPLTTDADVSEIKVGESTVDLTDKNFADISTVDYRTLGNGQAKTVQMITDAGLE